MTVRFETEEETDRLNEILQSRFITRSELWNSYVNWPDNSNDFVIIKSNERGTGFQVGQYDARYLEDVCSQRRFDDTVIEINKIMQRLWSKKTKMEKASLGVQEIVQFSVSGVSQIAFFLLAIYWIDAIWYTALQIVLGTSSFLGNIVLSFQNWLCKKDECIDFDQLV